MHKTVVFDVDGTLINPSEGVCRAVNYVIETYDLSPLPYETLLKFNGPPIYQSFMKHYSLSDEEINELVESFRSRYKDHDLLYATVYPGIYDLLDQLRREHFKIGIATYKRQDYAEKLLNHFGFDQYAEVICGSDYENKLTKKDIVRNCLQKLRSKNYAGVVMIGDSDNDAIAAEQIGMSFLGVTYGFGFEQECDVIKYNPLGVAAAPMDIYAILTGGIK